MKQSKKVHYKLIALAVVIMIIGAVSLIAYFSPQESLNQSPPQQVTLNRDTCTVDADCYTQCKALSSSESALYASCSYFAIVQPSCVNNRCTLTSDDVIIDRCLPSCVGDTIIPSECSIPRDTNGEQNEDAQCISRQQRSIACVKPSVCKNIYNGNCGAITATCVS